VLGLSSDHEPQRKADPMTTTGSTQQRKPRKPQEAIEIQAVLSDTRSTFSYCPADRVLNFTLVTSDSAEPYRLEVFADGLVRCSCKCSWARHLCEHAATLKKWLRREAARLWDTETGLILQAFVYQRMWGTGDWS
jgi:hypothetical protein